MKQTIGKRILAGFLAVFMAVSVLPVWVFAAVAAPAAPVLEDASYNSSNEKLTALATVDDVQENDDFELYMLVKSDPKNGMSIMTIKGVVYWLLGIMTTPVSDSTKVTVKSGKVQITDTMYWGSGTAPKNATVYVGVSQERNGAESEISNLKEIKIGEGGGDDPTEETWEGRFNATDHWDLCVSGASKCQIKDKGAHSFDAEGHTYTVSYPSNFDNKKPLSEENTPVLTDKDNSSAPKLSYNGLSFSNPNGYYTAGEKGAALYSSNVEGLTADAEIVGYNCDVCNFIKFDGVLTGSIDGATVEIDKPFAQQGATVTLTVKADNGVNISEITAVDGRGTAVKLSGDTSGSGTLKATYKMSKNGVKITVKTGEVPLKPTITLSQKTLSLRKGGTYTLNVAITPAKYANNEVAWLTSNESVATVDKDGLVTAVGVGTATITARTVIYAGGEAGTFMIEDTCEVTVSDDEDVDATSVTLNKHTLTIYAGSSDALSATVLPAGAASRLSWSSSNESIATVTQTGLVTGLTPGTVTITASVKNKTGTVQDTCEVTVTSGGGGGGYTPPITVTPTTTTPVEDDKIDISKYQITNEFDAEKGLHFKWSELPKVEKHNLKVKQGAENKQIADLGNVTECWVKHCTNGKYYVATTGDYTEYTYDKAKGAFAKTGTKTLDEIKKKPAANNVTDEYTVTYMKNGKESAIKDSFSMKVTTYYKPAITVTSGEKGVTIRIKPVPGATKYKLCKVVNGKLRTVVETEKANILIKGVKSGKTYTYVAKALVNDEWTKAFPSDHVSITV